MEEQPSKPVFLTCIEAGEFLRLSPKTLERQRYEGGGPRYHKFGRRVLYALLDLQDWAAARIRSNTSE